MVATMSLQDALAVIAAATQKGEIDLSTPIGADSTIPAVDDGVYFIGTVSKVAVHKRGLQCQESNARYWNVAKSCVDTVSYDGIEPGMRVRLILDAPDTKEHSARVIGWTPADAPLPTRGKATGKGANNGKGQGKGAAKAASTPTAPKEEFVPERKAAPDAAEALRLEAVEITARHRKEHGLTSTAACPFCGGPGHPKYKEWQTALHCQIAQYIRAGGSFDPGKGDTIVHFGQWVNANLIAVYSHNSRGFNILGGQQAQQGAAQAAPTASLPKGEKRSSSASDAASIPAPSAASTAADASKGKKRSPKVCAEADCRIWVSQDATYCKKHSNGAAEAAPNPKAKGEQAKTVAAKEASATEQTFRAVINKFPTNKTRMVKLTKLDGSLTDWFEYDASLDIARCNPGSVVDVAVRMEPATQSPRLVAYTLVEKPAKEQGIETSGKQLPPAPKVKHVTNRQRNAARKEAGTPSKSHGKQVTAARIATTTTEDPDAIFEKRSAENRLKMLAAQGAPAPASNIPGISVKEDARGIPQLVVDGAESRARSRAARNRKKQTGLIGPECQQCGRRFTMAGYGSTPGICGRCENGE